MLIGVVGLNGSGKDTVAEYLVANHGFTHKDLGQEIREKLKEQGKNHLDRNEMMALGNEMRRKHGFNYWCKKAIESVKSKNIVITSIRNPSEAEEIESRNGTIIEVFADPKLRFDRSTARTKAGLHGDSESFEHFNTMQNKELKNDDPSKQQIIKCIEMADYRIDNNGSLDNLHKQIETVISKIKEANLPL